MYQTLLTSLENGIFTITINRPDKLNALNKQVMNDLDSVLDEIEENVEVKSVLLTGSGAKAFVAGADISEFSGLQSSQGMELARRGQSIFFRIENNKKPFIAAVNGFALGGGCELAMACHFRIASENAKFGQPEVKLGLMPGYGGTQRLVHFIGKGRAMELLMRGNNIDAQTALQWGLINHLTTPEELLNKAKEILSEINTMAPIALAHCISSVNAVHDNSRNGFDAEIAAFGSCFDTDDMKEGTAAFMEKRKAIFKGN